MIILIPILIYIVFTIALTLGVSFLLKRKDEFIRKRVKKWIIGSAVILFFPLGLLYLSYLFGLALENHYDVKKGTFLWYATMDNETITDFPVFEPVGKVTYTSIGGDGPNIGTGWEIEYESKLDITFLTDKIAEYLKKEGYEIKSVSEPRYNWKVDVKKNETNELFSGSNDKGESLDLLLQKQIDGLTKVECSILY